MKKNWIAIIGSIVLGLTVAGSVFAESGEVINGTITVEKKVEADYPDLAKLTSDQAVQKALASVPGKMLAVKLESENESLIYDVEIVAADKSVTNVMVDAGSGGILAMEKEKKDNKKHESGKRDEDRDHEDS